MDISIIGSGHVGLVTGACLAEMGHRVHCVDSDREKIRLLQRGVVPFHEPGLPEMVATHAREGRLSFSSSIAEAVRRGTIIFICVGTPPRPDGGADLSCVEEVSREIARHMTDYRLVVEKSTVPVRTGMWMARTIAEHVPAGVEFDVASNPEFLREGTAIQDFLHPDRVVIGTSSERAAGLLVNLYEPLNAPLLLTDIRSAELIKHAANAFLAMKISFINSVARVCSLSGADVQKVAKGIGLDRRIGMDFLQAGIGFGGICLPKDLSAFLQIARDLGYRFDLLEAVQKVNEEQRRWPLERLREALETFSGRTVAVLGLAFKPDTDDLRNAPSLEVVEGLLAEGVRVRAYDPVAMEAARLLFPGVSFCRDVYHACQGADAAVVVTEWKQFRHLNLPRLREVMRHPLIIDGRNLYDPYRMAELGFEYYGVGRPRVSPVPRQAVLPGRS